MLHISHRAQIYLGTVAARCWAMSLISLIIPLTAPSLAYAFPGISNVIDYTVWAIGFAVVAVIATVATITRKDSHARTALIASMVVMAVWLASAVAGVVIHDQPVSSAVLVLLTAVLIKDSTMLRDPMHNPFEQLVPKDGPLTDEEVFAELDRVQREMNDHDE